MKKFVVLENCEMDFYSHDTGKEKEIISFSVGNVIYAIGNIHREEWVLNTDAGFFKAKKGTVREA
jgi:hypothetical protein